MREIVYIHAGTSHLASHFFNIQESYCTPGHEDQDIFDHDVSFREGRAPDGSTTFYPRLLLFDHKGTFGALSNIDALHAGEDETIDNTTWSDTVVEHRQDPIPQSAYHAYLEGGEDERDNDVSEEQTHDLTSSVRFWSDYSRVFYHPRGLHRVPDPAEWEHEVGWGQGAGKFTQYDVEHSVMENSFRLFAEECDLLQGVQLTLDAPSFGSFTIPFLTQLQDECPKLPLLTFCSLSEYDSAGVGLDDTSACIGVLNDALTLYELASLSTLTVPLRNPKTWRHGQWSEHVDADFTNPFYFSAILAAHIETATLPLRLKPSVSSSVDLATISAHLNWRGDTPFATLSGSLPVRPSTSDLDTSSYNFSHHASHCRRRALPFAQRDVLRGLYPHEKEMVQKWTSNETRPFLREPLCSTSYIDVPYPIPSSHPQFFTGLGATGRGILSASRVRVHSLPTYTSLRTTPCTGALARSYAQLMEKALRRRVDGLDRLGADRELMGEVVERYWGWCGAYGMEEGTEADGEWGEDERDVR